MREGVQITADPRTNALIVSGPLDYMELLEQIIKHLDLSAPQVAKIRMFSLKNADARQMALVLSSLFRLQTTSGIGTTANQRSVQYSLIRTPTEKTKTEDASKPDTTDKNAKIENESDETSAVVGSAEQQALTVTVDLRTNSLLVGGTEHYVALASEVIEKLDSTEAQERKTEVYRPSKFNCFGCSKCIEDFLAAGHSKDYLGFGTECGRICSNDFWIAKFPLWLKRSATAFFYRPVPAILRMSKN